jgi:hypothetical protein
VQVLEVGALARVRVNASFLLECMYCTCNNLRLRVVSKNGNYFFSRFFSKRSVTPFLLTIGFTKQTEITAGGSDQIFWMDIQAIDTGLTEQIVRQIFLNFGLIVIFEQKSMK